MPPAAPPPALEAGEAADRARRDGGACGRRTRAARRRRGGGGVGDAGEERAAIRALRSRYLAVYLPAVLADWIQGPYLYALYRAYGFDMTAIAHIFMAGYAASAVVGTVVASLGDSYGHRRSVLVYALTYCLCWCVRSRAPGLALRRGCASCALEGGDASALARHTDSDHSWLTRARALVAHARCFAA